MIKINPTISLKPNNKHNIISEIYDKLIIKSNKIFVGKGFLRSYSFLLYDSRSFHLIGKTYLKTSILDISANSKYAYILTYCRRILVIKLKTMEKIYDKCLIKDFYMRNLDYIKLLMLHNKVLLIIKE
jgi:hypothetical protein